MQQLISFLEISDNKFWYVTDYSETRLIARHKTYFLSINTYSELL